MSDLKRYFEISKVDAAQRMVWGYASTEAKDVQDETVTKDAMEGAWADYMQFANVREMHQPSAVGIVKEYEFRDTGVFIGAHIVDDVAWNKVTAGVYKGFSIGGKKLPGGYDAVTKTISKLRLTEISLVDRPANPEALIEMFKADAEIEAMPQTKTTEPSAADQLRTLVEKGGITPDRLLELVQAEVNKAAATGADVPQLAQPTTETQAEVVLPSDAPVTKAEPVPNAVQRALRALQGGEEAVQKGLSDVSNLASLLSCLRWAQVDSANEAGREDDGSPVPGQLADCVRALAAVLLAMAQEEVGEMMATMKADGAGKDAIDLLADKLATYLAKPTGADVTKVDALHVASSDDITKAVGAATAALTEQFEALQKSVTDATEGLDTVTKAYAELKASHDDLNKRWAKTPQQPKGVVMTVSKAEDGDALTTQTQEIAPVIKADGSVDDVATAIKKVHAGGGRPLGLR